MLSFRNSVVFLLLMAKVKVKSTLEQVTKAQRRSRGKPV